MIYSKHPLLSSLSRLTARLGVYDKVYATHKEAVATIKARVQVDRVNVELAQFKSLIEGRK